MNEYINDLAERIKAQERERLGKLIGYPSCWDTAAYPTLDDALINIGCNPQDCVACDANKKP